MGELVDKHVKFSRTLLKRAKRSADHFGVEHRRYIGLLVEQVASAAKHKHERMHLPASWDRLRAHSTVSQHILIQSKYWSMVETYSATFNVLPSEAVRQFVCIALEQLDRHPGAIPEEVPSFLSAA